MCAKKRINIYLSIFIKKIEKILLLHLGLAKTIVGRQSWLPSRPGIDIGRSLRDEKV